MSTPQGNPPKPQDLAATERERLRRVYGTYDADQRYLRRRQSPAFRFMLDRKWAAIVRLLRDPGFSSRSRVLDLGSGDKGDSARFQELGVPTSGIIAFDLNPIYSRRILDSNPTISAVSGDAAALPFRDGSFEIVYQSTMLSSVLEPGIRRRVLEGVARVLEPGGVFISYDVRYRNPWNPNTRPVKATDLREAFADWPLTIESLTGIPQLLRVLAPVSMSFCRWVEGIPPLRTHLLAVVRKPMAARAAGSSRREGLRCP